MTNLLKQVTENCKKKGGGKKSTKEKCNEEQSGNVCTINYVLTFQKHVLNRAIKR